MPRRDPIPFTSCVLTAVALVAFASNSVLCRIALGRALIGPGLFTIVRLASGTAMLGLLVSLRSRKSTGRAWSWQSAWALLLYAAPFSYAYVRLSAGVGALILFAAVQIAMIGSDLVRGATPHRREWLGLCIAVAGLAVLVAPGLNAADPVVGFPRFGGHYLKGGYDVQNAGGRIRGISWIPGSDGRYSVNL